MVVQLDVQAKTERYYFAQVKPFLEPEPAALNFMATVHFALQKYASAPTSDDCSITEVIEESDPRARSPEMQATKLQEVRDLLNRGTFKDILKEKLPEGANALTARFVLAIKSKIDGHIKFKARYVVGGHRDKLKQFMVHGAQTLQAPSARLIVALAVFLTGKGS